MNQQQVHENHEMSQALYEDLAALKIRIAFAEISEAELDEYDRELSSVSESDYSEAAQKRALKLIERKLNKRLSKRFIIRTLPHTLQVVAITMLLLFIGLTTAIATVRPVRLKILEFLAEIEDNYATISLLNDIEHATVPSEWKGEYFPHYVPEEFTFSRVDEFFNIVHYIAPNDRILEFSESTDNEYKYASITTNERIAIEINGNTGIACEVNDHTTIVWSTENTYFEICFSGELEEAQRIAESVQRIR